MTDIEKLATDNLILEVLTGSRAYGFHNEDSDWDSRGIFIATENERLGFAHPVEQYAPGKQDRTIYEIKKFIELASGCNPNILELLWSDPSDVKFVNEWGQILIDNRSLFLSKKAKHTFSGYAFSQLKRIKGHKKWINQPQKKDAPKVEDYIVTRSFPEIEAELKEEGLDIISSSPKQEFQIFNKDGYKTAFRQWRDYWEWKHERNPVRAKLEEAHGFDTKHACHLIRLLRMGIEILKDGVVLVKRPDAEELRAIRNGAYDYEKIFEMAENLMIEIDEAYEASRLPKNVDIDAANDLLINITKNYWYGTNK